MSASPGSRRPGPQAFETSSLLQCSTGLRHAGTDAHSVEEVAAEVVAHLRAHFLNKDTGDSALPLVRFFISRRSSQLEPDLQDFARAAAPEAYDGRDVVCLTLLASAGEEPGWNDRRASVAHQAIPLPSEEALERSPMVVQLLHQLGLDPGHLISPDPDLFEDLSNRAYDVFFVADARDSPYLPGQDGFVIPYGIRSAVGFGGVLPDGSFFAVLLFSRVPVPEHAVDAFGAIALSVKVAVLAHLGDGVFAGMPPSLRHTDPAISPEVLAEATTAALTMLLDVRAGAEEDEARRLERALIDAEERAAELAASRVALASSEARKTAIVEGALDSVIGMDSAGRITEFNRTAEATWGYDRSEVIGEMLADVLIPAGMRERHRLGLARLIATGEGPILGRCIEVNALHRDGSEFPIELTVTPVAGTDPPVFTGYARDVTSARESAAALATGRQRLAHIARTLQTSLLPPALPEIGGLELAAAFHALGDGYEVGGDFYDAWELADGRWAVSLGDVCGKGSEAAVVTALARYTLRAAAMRTRDPVAVLRMLNEAIFRQHPDRFCTAAYATIDPATGLIELALGGHPHPLLVTAAGDITRVGTTGQLLGSFEEWECTNETILLGPGDTLYLYSDGVTEARSGSEFFGEARLEAALRDGAGLDVSAAVKLIEHDVLAFAGDLNDDLAVLAVRRTAPPS